MDIYYTDDFTDEDKEFLGTLIAELPRGSELRRLLVFIQGCLNNLSNSSFVVIVDDRERPTPTPRPRFYHLHPQDE